MKKRLGVLLLGLLIIIVSVWVNKLPLEAINMDEGSSYYELVVYDGDTIEDLAEKLADASIIKYERVFILYGKISRKIDDIKPGAHRVNRSMGLSDLYRELSTYKELSKEKVKVAIPEGFNIRQIAKRLDEKGVLREREFLRAAKNGQFDYWFLEGVPTYEDKNYYKLEGFLFPATYEFSKNTTPEEVIHTLLKRFDYAISPHKEALNKLPYSVFDIIRMASVVERESKLPEEMDRIAGVFYNRLNIGMKLQSCATVQYLFEQQKAIVTLEDLKIDSPYNTYIYDGLPVGAISNPGDNAIKASLYPEENAYLFFVAIGSTGQHKFATSFEEHEENIKNYRD